jgi:hypothetical protein
MSYIGQEPGLGQAERFIYTATSSATVVSNDDDGRTIGYTLHQVSVYLNGVKQVIPTDVVASDGSTVVFASAYASGDVVEIIALSAFSPANTVPKTGGTFSGNVTAPSLILTPSSAPSSPSEGQMYYNSTTDVVYVYNGSAWDQVSNNFLATGGTITTDSTYKYHTYTTASTFIPTTNGNVDILVIAGGGSGGANHNSGGGGAGGVVWKTSQLVTANVTYTASIGAGGVNTGNANDNGDNSTLIGTGLSIIATGGGYGGSAEAGGNGGSGGGGYGTGNTAGGTGVSGQGNAGGAGTWSGVDYENHGGGGGGAGASGGVGNTTSKDAGDGGVGASTLTDQATVILNATDTTALLLGAVAGTDASNVATTSSSSGTLYIAGGGGGGSSWTNSSGGGTSTNAGGSAGLGGGGRGTDDVGSQVETAGLANTGAGGGGQGGHITGAGASGGSGIVIIRYAI